MIFSSLAVVFHAFGKCEQTFCCIRPSVKDNIFHELKQILRNFIVDLQHPGIDNSHIQTCFDRMEKKDRMDGFAKRIISAKREGNI